MSISCIKSWLEKKWHTLKDVNVCMFSAALFFILFLNRTIWHLNIIYPCVVQDMIIDYCFDAPKGSLASGVSGFESHTSICCPPFVSWLWLECTCHGYLPLGCNCPHLVLEHLPYSSWSWHHQIFLQMVGLIDVESPIPKSVSLCFKIFPGMFQNDTLPWNYGGCGNPNINSFYKVTSGIYQNSTRKLLGELLPKCYHKATRWY